MWAPVITTGLLCLSLMGNGRRVEKPVRGSLEESKRLQHYFGEEEHEESARKGSATPSLFAAQQSFSYQRTGGARYNGGGGVQLDFSPKRNKHGRKLSSQPFSSMSQSPLFTPHMTRERKPNIVLILTDDQDVELGSLNFMPRTLRLLREEGAEFRHAYVTTPMCCPSRSSLLTGMLVHNHQVFTNNDNCSGQAWQATHETRSFATYLSNAGYRTGYFGKYLNKYNGSYTPPGWREWAGLIMNSRYYNYSVNVNGKRIKHGFDYHKDYYPDLIANESVAFLQHSKQSFSRKPVMLVMSFPAPHGPEDSAPQFSHLFFNVTTHHTPAYDYAPNPDKQWILRMTGRMQPIHRRFTDLLMTKRLQTLQSVDTAVQKVYDALKELGELDNTYIVYTSDHGYHLGQFGLVKGKSFPFEFDIRVPFLVRGPGIEPGTIVDDIVLNVDLAPTFLDIAGVEPPPHMDGRSFLQLVHRGGAHKQHRMRKKPKWPDTFLVESSGRREIPPPSGDGHANGVAGNSKIARLNRECLLPDFQNPCQPGQKWTCVLEDKRWRKHKCKFLKGPAGNTGEEIPLGWPGTRFSEDGMVGSGWHTQRRGNQGGGGMYKLQVGRRSCTCFPPPISSYPTAPSHLLARLDQEERRMQRAFLRSHLSSGLHETSGYRPRFLKTAPILRRRKRSLGALLDTLLGGVTQQLRGLEQANNSSTVEFDSSDPSLIDNVTSTDDNSTSSTGRIPARCEVVGAGQVNCSRSVYKDSRVWRKSKLHVEEQIHRLRAQLDALKEIRRHLRHKRPPPGSLNASLGEDEADEDGNSSEEEEEEEEEDDEESDEEDEEAEDGDEEEEEYPDPTTTSTAAPTTTAAMVFSTTTDLPEPAVTTVKPHMGGKLGTSIHKDKLGNVCICGPDPIAEARRKQKELRMRRKERKMRRKAKLEEEHCLSEKMNCFSHDNSHWRTAPLWTEGPFCVCMNANNNTYSCLRTINASHNFLFCEFTTGLVTYYNLRIDPFEQSNRAHSLSPGELSALRTQLAVLKGCSGARQCRSHIHMLTAVVQPTNPPLQETPSMPLDMGRRRPKTGTGSKAGNLERTRPQEPDPIFDRIAI